ncbi:MAG: ABC transporter ATP-binding protein [Saprospiraceae bacterium]|nr:ABC transporter ATP-binding protein [Saprospiraceae bacterium]
MKSAIDITGLGKRYSIRSYEDYSLRTTLQQALKLKFRKRVPFWALRNIDISIPEGEVFGIIGTNGSGKSTLLKILSKIVLPTTGKVELAGKVNSLLEVGTGFHPELTGRENIFLNGAILGLKKSEIRSKFDRIVDFSEVEDFLDTPVKHFSSGMYVRLAFAVAVHLDPDILIVDEVLSVGDLAFQRKCIKKMEEEVLQGRTVLLVTHNMQIVQRLCDRVMLLHRGECMEVGKPKLVVDRYLQNIHSKVDATMEDPDHRRGSGTMRFVSIQVMNHDGLPVKVLPAGSGMNIRLGHKKFSKNTGYAVMHLIFKTMEGQLVSALIYSFQESSRESNTTAGETQCHVPRLPFNVGLYTLDLEIYFNDQLADLVSDAYHFEIIPGAFYHDGNLPGGQFPILIDFTWQ